MLIAGAYPCYVFAASSFEIVQSEYTLKVYVVHNVVLVSDWTLVRSLLSNWP